MDYRDVTNTQFRSKREVNPLMPTYTVRNDENKPHQIGPIEGNTSYTLPPQRRDPELRQTSLKTKDIQGCACTTKGLGNFHTRVRRTFFDTNVTKDILGAQPDTVKKSPDTLRKTNPLVPEYQYLGRLDLENKNDKYSGKVPAKPHNSL